ncbi:MAG: hypothetical protein SynsKO_11560 [Synoicihabitans sp.]
MIKLCRLILLMSVFWVGLAAAASSPQAVLKRALAYHDPHGDWPSLRATFRFIETRPDGRETQSVMEIDNPNWTMRLNFSGKESYEIVGEACTVLSGDKDAARGLMLRNYFIYLWGLPMKLTDPGTTFVPEVGVSEINGFACDVLRVVYEKDTWYFHIDQNSGRMRQYEFYKDETKAAGEIITLEGEVSLGSIRIPQKRAWYKIPGNEYLGTDILDTVERTERP